MLSKSILTLFLVSLLSRRGYASSGDGDDDTDGSDGGANVCDEVEECAGDVIDAEADGLQCTNFLSCAGALIGIECSEDKCYIECTEEDSCAAAVIAMDLVESVQCSEARACQYTFMTLNATESFSLECSDTESCRGAEIFVTVDLSLDYADTELDQLQCDGEQACKDASIFIERLKKAEFEGFRAGYDGNFEFYDPADDFELSCEGDSSCMGANFLLEFSATAPDTSISSIECESSQACNYAYFTIENLSSDTVTIEELKCEGYESCTGIVFDVTGSVTIEKCICEDPEGLACQCVTGLNAICEEFEGTWTSTESTASCST